MQYDVIDDVEEVGLCGDAVCVDAVCVDWVMME
jgi:hypothetical protein